MPTAVQHCIHLLSHTIDTMVAAKGTTKLGLVLAVGISGLVWCEQLLGAWRRMRRDKVPSPFWKAFRECYNQGKLAIKWTLIVGMSVFGWFLVATIYEIHQSCVARNQELLGRGNGNHYAIFLNNQYASTINTFIAFSSLRNTPVLPEINNPCHLRIVAPQDNRHIAQILSSIAQAAHCFVEPNDAFAVEDITAPTGVVLIHAPLNHKSNAEFVTALSNIFNVKLITDIPSGENILWLQIGTGNVWRKN